MNTVNIYPTPLLSGILVTNFYNVNIKYGNLKLISLYIDSRGYVHRYPMNKCK